MSYSSLADFLEELNRVGELRLVEDQVDEAQICAPVQVYTASLFRNVRDQSFPLAAGLLGTEPRIRCALEVDSLSEAADRVERAFAAAPSRESLLKDGVDRKTDLLAPFAPRLVKAAACQKIVRLGTDVDLESFPGPPLTPSGQTVTQVGTHFDPELSPDSTLLPLKPNRSITAAVLITRDPISGNPVIGHATLSIRARNELAVHWEPLDPLARLLDVYRQRSESMPLAVALGGHPARLLSAMAKPPFPVDRDCLAGLLAGGPLESVRCRSIDLEVPAEADFILEGTIDPAAARVETGLMITPCFRVTLAPPAPVLRIAAFSRRSNPVLPLILPGPAAAEWAVITSAMHRVLLPLTRLVVDELVDCNLPEHGNGRTMAWVSIRKTDVESARRVAHALWELPGTRFCRFVVLVDEDVDVDDGNQIWAAKGRNADDGRDVFMKVGPPDPWANQGAAGEPFPRLAFDATTKWDRPRMAAEPTTDPTE